MAHVHDRWHEAQRRRRRRWVVWCAVVAVAVVAPATIAATVGYGGHVTSHVSISPGYPDIPVPNAPTAIAQPSVGLVDGQTITVTVRGLDPHTTVEVAQCAWVRPVADGVLACAGLVDATVTAAPQPVDSTTSTSIGVAPPTTRFSPRHTIATATLVVHDPLGGHLTLYDLGGDPVHGREPPTVRHCTTSSSTAVAGQSCLIGIRGRLHGHRTVLPAQISFAPDTPPGAATTQTRTSQ